MHARDATRGHPAAKSGIRPRNHDQASGTSLAIVRRCMAPTRTVLVALVAFAALPALPAPIAAQEAPRSDRGWRTEHIALATAFAVSLEIDAAQTREAMRRGFRETNPLLGQHPSEGRVNTYTAVAGLAVLGTASAVPARWRPWVLGLALAVETFTIAGTVREGISIRFP
jgi:hypothetical protein